MQNKAIESPSPETLEKIDQSKNRKAALNNSCTTCTEKTTAQAAYTEANKMEKKNTRADKRAYLDSLTV